MSKKEIPKPELAKPQSLYNNIWLGLIIGVIGFLVYANTIGHDYVYDDSDAVIKNLYVQEGISGIPNIFKVDFWYFQNLKMGYYRPLSLVTFAIEHEFFGNNPHVGHFDNALFYGLTGFLLFLLLIKIFPAKNPAFSLLICLVFMAHPIHTEVVANIKSRDEIFSFLNIITMLLFALQYKKTKKISAFVWSIIFFYLALLSKETAMVGLALLPVILYYSGNKIQTVIIKTLPYVGAIILFLLQKRYFLGSQSVITYENLNSFPYTDSAIKLPTVFNIFRLCLGLLIFPWPLSYDYSYNQVPASHWGDLGAILGMVIFIGLAVLAVIGAYKKTIWGLGLAVIYITLVPSMAFVYLRGGVMVERFLYAPCLGFGILLIYGLSLVFKKPEEIKLNILLWAKNNVIITCIVLLISIIFSIETIARNTVWKDQFTLFSSDMTKASESAQANLLYGTVILDKAGKEKDSVLRKKDFDLGMEYCKKASRIYPGYGQTYCDIGFAYAMVEVNRDSALKYFRKCVQVAPGYARGYVNLGILYQNVGRLKLASYYYNKAVESNPLLADGKTNADNLKKATGLDVHEFPDEDTTLPTKPVETTAPVNVSPEKMKKFEDYFSQGEEAVKKNDFMRGIKFFKKAELIEPDNEKNLIYLANSYGMAKQYSEAINTFQLILKLHPDDQAVIKNLAITYDMMGEKEKAEEVRKKLKQ